jgi:hypothetical protein
VGVGRGMNEDIDRVHMCIPARAAQHCSGGMMDVDDSVFHSYACVVCTHLKMISQSYCVNG